MHNHRFHQCIGEMAQSPYLMPSLDRLLIDHTRIGQVFYRSNTRADRQRITKAVEQHEAMIEALEQREPARMVQLTLDHWELSRHQLEQFVTPDPLPFELASDDAEKKHAV